MGVRQSRAVSVGGQAAEGEAWDMARFHMEIVREGADGSAPSAGAASLREAAAARWPVPDIAA